MKSIKLLLALLISAILFTACSSRYKVAVDITPERAAELNQEIEDYQKEIRDFVSPDNDIPFGAIIGMARDYEELGDYGKAIELYRSTLKDHPVSKAMTHNLGRDYEAVGEYDLAVEQYQKIIDDYFDYGYLYDITWAYIKAGNRREAESSFNDWQLKFRKTDDQTQAAIKKLTNN